MRCAEFSRVRSDRCLIRSGFLLVTLTTGCLAHNLTTGVARHTGCSWQTHPLCSFASSGVHWRFATDGCDALPVKALHTTSRPYFLCWGLLGDFYMANSSTTNHAPCSSSPDSYLPSPTSLYQLGTAQVVDFVCGARLGPVYAPHLRPPRLVPLLRVPRPLTPPPPPSSLGLIFHRSLTLSWTAALPNQCTPSSGPCARLVPQLSRLVPQLSLSWTPYWPRTGPTSRTDDRIWSSDPDLIW